MVWCGVVWRGVVWYGNLILPGEAFSHEATFQGTHRTVQTQAVNLTHIGKSRSSRVISHGDIPTHRYNTASRAVAFLKLKSIFI